MQDQAFLGPESGLAVPAEDGGVDLYVATQWLHVDQRQICAGARPAGEKVRLTLAGVGGAFGGREDLSMQVHACLLALRTEAGEDGLQPRGVLLRPRAPPSGDDALRARRRPRRHAGLRQRRVVLDGGAYASELPGRGGQRGNAGRRPVCRPERAARLLRLLHQQPAVRVRCAASARCRPLRLRGADGQARRRARHGPGRAAAPQRDERGRDRHADRAGRRQPGAGRRVAAPGAGDAAPPGGRSRRADLREPSRRGVQHDPRRGRRPRDRLRRRLQERRLLRGLRRLLDRPGAARGRQR